MQTIGVRELKAHLSEYLKRVQAGEHVTITDRGRPIAIIAPATAARRMEWAHALVAEGHARWDGGKPTGLSPRLKSRGKPASQMVLEDRR